MKAVITPRIIVLTLLVTLGTSVVGNAPDRSGFKLRVVNAQTPFIDLLHKLESGGSFQTDDAQGDGEDRIEQFAYPHELPDSVAEPRTSLILNAIADATVIQNAPTFDASATTDMWAGYDSCLSPPLGLVHSLVAFDTDSIPSSSTITNAMLRVYMVTSCDSPGDRAQISTHGINAGWTESGVNWTNMPSFSGSYGSHSILHAEYGWYEFEVTELVQAWHDSQMSNYGIMITGPTASGFRGFSTREGTSPPELVIEHEPVSEPPTATNTPVNSPTPVNTQMPTDTPTMTPTNTPTDTPTPTNTATSIPVNTPTPISVSNGRIFLPSVHHKVSGTPVNEPTTTSTAVPEPTAIATTPPPPPATSTTTPAREEVTCLYALNWWINHNPPYNIVRSLFTPPCLGTTNVTITHIYDEVGRQTKYIASGTREGKPDFDMEAYYIFNSGGGVEGADITKTYEDGSVYQMEITQFCPTIGTLFGYIVEFDGQEITVGACP